MPSKKDKNKKHKPTMAEKANRHKLYEQSVQCVESEIDFVDETYKELRRRYAVTLREDFCGTANTSCEWVRRRGSNRATGIDLDADVLEWGKRHNLSKLKPEQADRIQLINGDVLKVETEPTDIVLAMNFSYWVFKDRPMMREYFSRVRNALTEDGVFFLDAFGGYEAQRVMTEHTKYKKHTYIWDQAYFNPINSRMCCHIHFKMKDGSRINKAFSYDWRLWSLQELQELLQEAGYKDVAVYWQDEDEESEEGNGEFYRTDEGTPDAGWIAYIVAQK